MAIKKPIRVPFLMRGCFIKQRCAGPCVGFIMHKKYSFYLILCCQVFAYAFKFTEDLRTHTVFFQPVNKARVISIESDTPVYFTGDIHGPHRFSSRSTSYNVSKCDISPCFQKNSFFDVAIQFIKASSRDIPSSADRIIAFLHRGTAIPGSSDDF